MRDFLVNNFRCPAKGKRIKRSPFHSKGLSTHTLHTYIHTYIHIDIHTYRYNSYTSQVVKQFTTSQRGKEDIYFFHRADVWDRISAFATRTQQHFAKTSLFHLHSPISPFTSWNRCCGSGQRVWLLWGELHRFQFIGEDAKNFVKLLIAPLSVGWCARLTPKQPQGELCPESLQQLGDRLPATWWRRATDIWSDHTPHVMGFSMGFFAKCLMQEPVVWTGLFLSRIYDRAI